MATLTKHNNLKIVGLNESADIREVVKNFEVIDDGLCKFYVATLKSTNIYSVETGTNKTTLADGYGLTIAIPSNSTGAVKINVDSFTAPLVKSDGNPVTNLKQNGIYTLRYYKGNFILASGGADDVNFSTSDLLEGKTANNSDGEKVNGTMKNVGQQTATINAGGKVTISKGYHNGTGYIQANSMSTQLNSLGVTLTGANQLVNGVKAVDKNGNVITGTATIESLGGLVKQEGTFVRSTGSEATVTLGYRPKMVICMLADNNQEFYFDLGQELCSFIPTRVRLIAKSDGRDCYYYWNWTDTDFYKHYGVKITDNGFTHKPVGGYGQSVRYITFR